MKNKNIGVFDSGVGGLTVVKRLIELLPNENIIYFGDTARVPYGPRSNSTILRYALQDINFLKSQDIKIIIAACGTVSSVFFKNNINNFYFKDFFFTGIIEMAAKKAVAITKNKNIGIIGTKATIKSKSYETYIKNLDSKIKTYSVACPLFVSIIEENLFNNRIDITNKIIDLYLKDLKKSNIDTLILGCTHYPLIKDLILNYFDNKIKIVDPGVEIAKFTKSYLTQNNLINNNINKNNIKFFVSDSVDNFKNIAKSFLNIDLINQVRLINLENLENADKNFYPRPS
ncbi:MAG: glutamate racemase [Oscillospiraceae bacterium]|nr:glutamate racemase [Oscillospiraceae bacterium]